ncbi:MAG: hypothetical protein AB3N13_07300 [Arenibacterium sp.]
MSVIALNDTTLDAPLLEFLTEERKKALSTREWEFRLAGFGYGIKDRGSRRIVTRLTSGDELGTLPAELS